ncbi:MAG: 50S ribosomal protein L24 [Parcubacteria group bacterium]|nr:50S ribosomal protein L24 [Parcubacteria group bacterium]MBI2175577.1 50S ribosomal protein L24 [Parcubacteria group bacterium]
MRIKKGDTVVVLSGKDKGKRGKVQKTLVREERLVIEDISMRKRRVRPRRKGEKGQTIETAMPIHASNALLVCPQCQRPTRVGTELREGKKVRICKKCAAPLS